MLNSDSIYDYCSLMYHNHKLEVIRFRRKGKEYKYEIR